MTGEYTTFEVVKGVKDKIQCPTYVDSAAINLSENALKVLERRYIRRGEDGNPTETIGGMFYRVAKHIASTGNESRESTYILTETFYNLLSSLSLPAQQSHVHRCGNASWSACPPVSFCPFRMTWAMSLTAYSAR